MMTSYSRSIRTPLAKVRGLGAAHSGTEHFWRQRVTAVSNLVLVIAFLPIFVLAMGRDHAGAIAIVSHPLVAILLILAIVSVTTHMRMGVQIIIEDYVHAKGWKIAALIANTFYAVIVAVACLYAILKIGLGRSL